MNLNYEFLQELIITTAAGRILRLHIGKQTASYRLYGEYFDSSTQQWTLVDFASERQLNAKSLLEQCIKDFATAMSKLNDKISSLHNPCNAPFVTKPDQEGILTQQSITATVTVN